MLEQHEPLHAARFYRALGLAAAVRVHDMLTSIYAMSKTCAPKPGQAKRSQAKPIKIARSKSTPSKRSTLWSRGDIHALWLACPRARPPRHLSCRGPRLGTKRGLFVKLTSWRGPQRDSCAHVGGFKFDPRSMRGVEHSYTLLALS